MLDMEDWMEIKEMKRDGQSIRQISRITGCSRNTVRKVLRGSAAKRKTRKRHKSILDEYKPYLKKRYRLTGLSAVRLLEEIKPMGYGGEIDTIRRYLRTIDEEERISEKATVRFETAPGVQAQVDWAEIGRLPDANGVFKKIYAFVIVLGFSRMMYVEFTYSMKLDVLIECHQRAFEYFGGYTSTILYDNMAQVRLPSGKLNLKMMDFLSHYGIAPKTHRPYRPRTKGKVERSVRYLKDNFIKGREFADFADLQARGRGWMDRTANSRVPRDNRKGAARDAQGRETSAACSTVPDNSAG